MGKGSWQLSLFQGVVCLFLFSGFYLPMLSFFFGKNPFEPGKYLLDLNYLLEFLSDSWNLQVIWFSFYQAFWSAILAVLVGIPGAWILSRYDFPGKRLFRILFYLPFILPSIIVVLGMVLFFGNNGFVNQTLQWIFGMEEPPFQFLYSLQGILIAHVFYNFPIAMKTLSDHWERLSPQYGLVARSLGASRLKTLFRVHLPLMIPSLVSAFVLIFLLCLNSFAIILVLGGGVRYTNIEVLIYQLARIHLDFNGATSLAFLQLVMSLFFLFFLFRKIEYPVGQGINTKKNLMRESRAGAREAIFSCIWLVFIITFAFGPLISIVVDSFRAFENNQWNFTIRWYRQLFELNPQNTFLSALWNSLKIGLSSACLSSLLGLGMASIIHLKKGVPRKLWELAALFPIGVSTVILGVVWFVFFQDVLIDYIPLTLILILIHAILTFPYWIRVVLPALDSVPPRWLMVSQTLGKTPVYFYLKILIPWLKRVLVIGFFFSFSLSLGELNSTLMVADESLQTLPLEIYRAIAGYRFSFASAVGVMLLILTVVVFTLIEEWTRQDTHSVHAQKFVPLN